MMTQHPSRISLTLRSLFWTVLLPGVIAGYVPAMFFGLRPSRVDLSSSAALAGLSLVIVGGVLLIACIYEFARSGRGTLSPVDPPQELVVRGLYRYVRNPMYLSVTLVLLGEALLIDSWALAVYWAVWFAWVNVFVIAYEERTLRHQFGASYDVYTRQVRRWVPNFRSHVSLR